MRIIVRKTRISMLYCWNESCSIFWRAHRARQIHLTIENIQRYDGLNKAIRDLFFAPEVTNLRFCAGKRQRILTTYPVTDHVKYKYHGIIPVELDNHIR